MSTVNVYCVEVTSTNLQKLQKLEKSNNAALQEIVQTHFVGTASSTVADVLAHIEKSANPLAEVQQAQAEETAAKKLNLFAILADKSEDNLRVLREDTTLASLVSAEYVCFEGDSEDVANLVLLYSPDAEYGIDGETCCLIAMCAACCACCIGILCCCCNKGDKNNNNNNN